MKKHFSLMMALLMVSAMLFSCKKDEGPQKIEYKPSFTKAEQASYNAGAEFATYAINFTGEEASLEMNFSAALNEIPMAAGEYTIAEELSAAKQAVVTSYKNDSKTSAVKAKSGKVKVSVDGSEYTFDFDFIMTNNATLKGSFKGSVANMEQPKPEDYKVTFTSAERTKLTEGEKFDTYEVSFKAEKSSMNAIFAVAKGTKPLAAGEYAIAAELSKANEFTAVYKNEEGKDINASSGKVTVALDGKTKAYTFTFEMGMSDELTFNGSFEGEVKNMDFEEVPDGHKVTFTASEKVKFTEGENYNTFELSFTAEKSSMTATFAAAKGTKHLAAGEYAVAAKLSKANEFTAVFKNEEGKDVTVSAGKVVVALDAKTKVYTFSFEMTMSDKLKFNGSYEGEVKNMEFTEPVNLRPRIESVAQIEFVKGTPNKYVLEFSIKDSDKKFQIAFFDNNIPLAAGEYTLATEGERYFTSFEYEGLKAKSGKIDITYDAEANKYGIKPSVVMSNPDGTEAGTLMFIYSGEIKDIQKPEAQKKEFVSARLKEREDSESVTKFHIAFMDADNNETIVVFGSPAYSFPMPAHENFTFQEKNEYWSIKEGELALESTVGHNETPNAGTGSIALADKTYTINFSFQYKTEAEFIGSYTGEIQDMQFEKPYAENATWNNVNYTGQNTDNTGFDVVNFRMFNTTTWNNSVTLEISVPKGLENPDVIEPGEYTVVTETGEGENKVKHTKTGQVFFSEFVPVDGQDGYTVQSGKVKIERNGTGMDAEYTITLTDIVATGFDLRSGTYTGKINYLPKPIRTYNWNFTAANQVSYDGFKLTIPFMSDEYVQNGLSVTIDLVDTDVLKGGTFDITNVIGFHKESGDVISASKGTMTVTDNGSDNFSITMNFTDGLGNIFNITFEGTLTGLKTPALGTLSYGKATGTWSTVTQGTDTFPAAIITFTEGDSNTAFESLTMSFLPGPYMCGDGTNVTKFPVGSYESKNDGWCQGFDMTQFKVIENGTEKPFVADKIVVGYDKETSQYTFSGEIFLNDRADRYILNTKVKVEGEHFVPEN